MALLYKIDQREPSEAGGIKLATSQVVLHVLLGPLVGDRQIHCGLPEATVVQGLVVGNY